MADLGGKYARVISFAVLIAALFVLTKALGWDAYSSSGDFLAALVTLADSNLVLTAFVYGMVSIVGSAVFAVPGMVFALAAGVLFGPWLGTLLCAVSCTIGAIGAFLVGRYFLKDALQPALEKNQLLKRWLFENANQSAVVLLAVTRLVPLFPFNVQNFAYGITNVSLGLYSALTLVFIIPGTAFFTFAASGVMAQEDCVLCAVVCTVLLIVVVGLSVFLKRRFGLASEADNDR